MYCFPTDCVRIIIDYLDIEDTVNACLGLSNPIDLPYLLKDRKSPIRLFSHLVDDPVELMHYMSTYSCILSGSRSSNYFCPGTCTDDSDWDFFVASTERHDVLFGSMTQAFASMGVRWEEPGRSSSYEVANMRVLKGVMEKGRGLGQTVQLISSSSSEHMARILDFHSTPTQSVITHYGAVHFYGKLSRERRQLIWHKSIDRIQTALQEINQTLCPVYRLGIPHLDLPAGVVCACIEDNTEESVRKYEHRGYKHIDFNEYKCTAGILYRIDHSHWIKRSGTDKDTTIVSFEGYNTLCPDKQIRNHFKWLSELVWHECDGNIHMWTHTGNYMDHQYQPNSEQLARYDA